MNARYYVPAIGRFASADTIVPNPADPQSFNRYAYTLNNPLRYTDPSGHRVDEGAGGVGGGQYCTIYGCIAGVATPTLEDIAAIADDWESAPWQFQVAVTLLCPACEALVLADGFQLSSDWGMLLEAVPILGVVSDIPLHRLIPDIRAGKYADEIVTSLCSFSEKTLVATEQGIKPISEVELYDKVLAYDEETGDIGYYLVVAIWAHEDPVIVTLTIDGEVIETTPEHPFYTADGEWAAAGNLQVGDELREADWDVGVVEGISFSYQPEVMYNFTVATAHTYFVGEGQWLVHNSCDQLRRNMLRAMGGGVADGMQAHHLIPYSLRNHPLVKMAGGEGWDIDGVTNGIFLPDNPALGRQLGLPYHSGDHPYNRAGVATLLDDYYSLAVQNDWSPHQVATVLEGISSMIADTIRSGTPGSRLR